MDKRSFRTFSGPSRTNWCCEDTLEKIEKTTPSPARHIVMQLRPGGRSHAAQGKVQPALSRSNRQRLTHALFEREAGEDPSEYECSSLHRSEIVFPSSTGSEVRYSGRTEVVANENNKKRAYSEDSSDTDCDSDYSDLRKPICLAKRSKLPQKERIISKCNPVHFSPPRAIQGTGSFVYSFRDNKTHKASSERHSRNDRDDSPTWSRSRSRSRSRNNRHRSRYSGKSSSRNNHSRSRSRSRCSSRHYSNSDRRCRKDQLSTEISDNKACDVNLNSVKLFNGNASSDGGDLRKQQPGLPVAMPEIVPDTVVPAPLAVSAKLTTTDPCHDDAMDDLVSQCTNSTRSGNGPLSSAGRCERRGSNPPTCPREELQSSKGLRQSELSIPFGEDEKHRYGLYKTHPSNPFAKDGWREVQRWLREIPCRLEALPIGFYFVDASLDIFSVSEATEFYDIDDVIKEEMKSPGTADGHCGQTDPNESNRTTN